MRPVCSLRRPRWQRWLAATMLFPSIMKEDRLLPPRRELEEPSHRFTLIARGPTNNSICLNRRRHRGKALGRPPLSESKRLKWRAAIVPQAAAKEAIAQSSVWRQPLRGPYFTRR